MGLAYDLIAGRQQSPDAALGFQPAQQQRRPASPPEASGCNQRLGGSTFGVALRGSYSYAAANNLDPVDPATTALGDEENLQGLAFGGGLNYGTGNFNVGFDYAWKYLGVLGATNFFSVSLGW